MDSLHMDRLGGYHLIEREMSLKGLHLSIDREIPLFLSVYYAMV
jgi:hypothetical protein